MITKMFYFAPKYFFAIYAMKVNETKINHELV